MGDPVDAGFRYDLTGRNCCAITFLLLCFVRTTPRAQEQQQMCGRTFQKTPLREIRVLFETVNAVPNAAPTDPLPVVRLDRDERSICCAGG